MEATKKRLALVAHDNLKRDLADWVAVNGEKLLGYRLVCTGTTGKLVAKTLLAGRDSSVGAGADAREGSGVDADARERPDVTAAPVTGPGVSSEGLFEITMLKSGPLGGDQQLGAMIAEGKIDAVVFFWDPMQAQPHDVDVKALLRLATLYNVPTAINRSSADLLISSPLFDDNDYKCVVHDYGEYVNRVLN
ncbi:MAG: methylglyoxal synthase [Alistipes sp.]|jgi:methylglyoxal synthase|nr:methylglyoxal synthase [Alistipes sp.]